MAGGATKPTKILLATTGGEYLETQMYGLETFKEKGWRADRPITTSVVADGGWSPDNLGLTACEDTSKVKILDKKGKEVFKDRDIAVRPDPHRHQEERRLEDHRRRVEGRQDLRARRKLRTMNRRPVAVMVASLVGAAVLLGTGPLPEASAAGPTCNREGSAASRRRRRRAAEAAARGAAVQAAEGTTLSPPAVGGKSGPSKLEIARKQEKAINRAVAKFQNSLKAYTSCVEGGGDGCTAPKAGGAGGERGAAPRWC